MGLHCHNCNWFQDDFYSPDGYNPFDYLRDNWKRVLFDGLLDEHFTDDSGFIEEHGRLTNREVLAREFESWARRIRSQRWITYEDFKACIMPRCPQCGNRAEFDID